MIPEKEREALMRLTMCARGECPMCKYEEECDDDFQEKICTKNMNILADALRAEQTEPQTENLFIDKDGDVWEWRGDAWYCISGQDEPQTEEWYTYQDEQEYNDRWQTDEPQTDCSWK